jgi:tetratricopeptide (TPR) repeat protein
MNRRQRRSTASKSIPGGAARADGGVAAVRDAVLGDLRAGKVLEAQLRVQRALEAKPDNPELLHLMASACLDAKAFDHAVEWASRAIRGDPQASYLATLGFALQRAGRLDEASKVFDKAVQLRPDDAALWTRLGLVLGELKRPAEAVLCFQHALKLDPRQWEAAWESAVLLLQLGRLEEALAHLDLCERLRPRQAPVPGLRWGVLRGLERYEEYLADVKRAHALDPNNADVCSNIGDALVLLGRFEEALEWFDRAFSLRPSFVLALENKAKVLRKVRRFDELWATYRQIMTIDPANALAEFSFGSDSLLVGNFEVGWKAREARWRVPGLRIFFPQASEPVWLGKESLEDKTILIYSDEGLGDAIQFTRYVPMLAARGARVVLVVQDALCSLLSTLPGLSECLPKSSRTLPPVDFRCPLMSLPLAFGTTLDTIPPPVRLSAPADRVRAWEQRLGSHDRLRVGLVWSGSPMHTNDRERSIALQSLTSLLDVDATFVSLQKDPRPDDAALLRERTEIADWTADLTDFTETAALVSCLDLVITVDTSTAHLAGAMGCPTWVLLRHTPDWRWLLKRDDNPWYPTVRLFRQDARQEYGSVIERVRAELLAVAASRRTEA